MGHPASEEFTPEETVARRDEVVRRMLATPPQPKAVKAPPSKKTGPTASGPKSSGAKASRRP